MADPVTAAIVVGSVVVGAGAAKALAPKAPDAPPPPPTPVEDKDLSAEQAAAVAGNKQRDIKRAKAAKEQQQFQSLLKRQERAAAGQSLIETKSLLGE